MIIQIKDNKGQTAYIDNEGQVNGNVRIQGDTALVSHLNHILNLDIDLPFINMRSTVPEKFKIKSGRITVLYKASDDYLKEHFIPKECPAFGYAATILKE